jgi:long-chain fatty acid transport protein
MWRMPARVRKILVSIFAAALMQSVVPAAVKAQLRAGQTVASFELNLSNPGARSLGMGGAFAGIADDATAAYSNPAALVSLTRPEISYEARMSLPHAQLLFWETPKTGSVEQSTGVRFEAERTPQEVAWLGGASFVSATYGGNRWATSIYHHQLADSRARATFQGHVNRPETHATFSFDVAGQGLSGAFRVNDSLSVGGTLVHYRARALVSEEQLGGGGEQLGIRSTKVDDSDLSFNLGVLFEASGSWSVGAYYRDGASFNVIEEDSTRRPPRPPGAPIRPPPSPLNFPNIYGVGVGYQINQNLLVAAEWSRISYSRLNRAENLPADFPDNRLQSSDADEFRFGLEYALWDLPAAPAFRFGVWIDPDHSLRAVGPALPCPGEMESGDLFVECSLPAEGGDLEAAESSALSNGFRRLFPEGHDEVHLTAGVGFVRGQHFQVDAALDYVDLSRPLYSVSAVLRF